MTTKIDTNEQTHIIVLAVAFNKGFNDNLLQKKPFKQVC